MALDSSGWSPWEFEPNAAAVPWSKKRGPNAEDGRPEAQWMVFQVTDTHGVRSILPKLPPCSPHLHLFLIP